MLPNLHDSNSYVCAIRHVITLGNSLGSFEILFPLERAEIMSKSCQTVSEGLKMQNITVDKKRSSINNTRVLAI